MGRLLQDMFFLGGLLFCSLALLACGSSGSGSSGVGRGRAREFISVDSQGNLGEAHSRRSAQNQDGSLVVFASAASNLVSSDTNGEVDIFLRNRVDGTTSRVNLSSTGAEALGGDSFNPSISDDGTKVVFESDASNLVVGDGNFDRDVFLRDLSTAQSQRLSVTTTGVEAQGDSRGGVISGDGEWVVFESDGRLDGADDDKYSDVYLYEVASGSLSLVSQALDGSPANGASMNPRLSSDGGFIVFQSEASNLVSFDENGKEDIFLYDRAKDSLELVSLNIGGSQAGGDSYRPSVSDDGDRIVFESDATDLIGAFNDSNSKRDVFIRLRSSASTSRLSVDSDGVQSNGDSYNARISRDGELVVFESLADTLQAFDDNGERDVFSRDIDGAITTLLSDDDEGEEGNGASRWPCLSADAAYVCYTSEASDILDCCDDNGVDDVIVRQLR